MINYSELALTYGGFTSLDLVYLENVLDGLTDQQKLDFITPPPSVINAYFAEIYQKQSPNAATDYYFNLSKALNLWDSRPSFNEIKPFVRLNLSGKAFGFAYTSSEYEKAIVFSEETVAITENLLLEIAQIFPHYVISHENDHIIMAPNPFGETLGDELPLADALLTKLFQMDDETFVYSSFNLDEIVAISQNVKGKKYYGFGQREFKIYIKD